MVKVVRCHGNWSLKSIRSVHQSLLNEMNDATAVTLDCASVTACDTAGVQLVASLFGSFATLGRSLRISELSLAMAQSLARAGLTLSPSGDELVCGGN
ncbi:MAG: lipid asymmetry maintenance protein MlaB [Bosea sp. (in: a-proteobacteria)]